MSIDGFVLPPRITLEEATRGAAPTIGVKRKDLIQLERHTNKGLPWRDDEHAAFLEGLERLGKGSWLAISRQCVPSRNPTQIASHAQKYFLRRSRGVSRASRFSQIEEGVRGDKPPSSLCSWNGQCDHMVAESSSEDELAIICTSGSGGGGMPIHTSCEIEQQASDAILELARKVAILSEPAAMSAPLAGPGPVARQGNSRGAFLGPDAVPCVGMCTPEPAQVLQTGHRHTALGLQL